MDDTDIEEKEEQEENDLSSSTVGTSWCSIGADAFCRNEDGNIVLASMLNGELL